MLSARVWGRASKVGSEEHLIRDIPHKLNVVIKLEEMFLCLRAAALPSSLLGYLKACWCVKCSEKSYRTNMDEALIF